MLILALSTNETLTHALLLGCRRARVPSHVPRALPHVRRFGVPEDETYSRSGVDKQATGSPCKVQLAAPPNATHQPWRGATHVRRCGGPEVEAESRSGANERARGSP